MKSSVFRTTSTAPKSPQRRHQNGVIAALPLSPDGVSVRNAIAADATGSSHRPIAICPRSAAWRAGGVTEGMSANIADCGRRCEARVLRVS